MESVSVDMIMRALDGLALRSSITAQNIANANTPGYRAMRVSFEETLTAMARGDVSASALSQPAVDYASGAQGEPDGMRLDLEVARAGATSMRYSALVELLGRQLQMHSLAVTGGR